MAAHPVPDSVCGWNVGPVSHHPTLTPSAITFSVLLSDAPEQTVLLPNELPGQLDVHVYLTNPGEAMGDIFCACQMFTKPLLNTSSSSSVSQV